MMNKTKLRLLAGLAMGAAATLSTASEAQSEGVNFTAGACPPGEKADQSEHKRTVFETATVQRAPTVSKQVFVTRSSDDGETYELKMHDGKVLVFHNGQAVQDEHIKRSEGNVIVLGKDGEELTTFELNAMGKTPPKPTPPQVWVESPKSGAFRLSGPNQVVVPGLSTSAPPVMLGVTLGEPGAALRSHLGLGGLQAILIEGVTKGLAADRAGLQKFDVVVSIDGSKEASGEILRKTLGAKAPGDVLHMYVMRGCDKIEVSAELDKYNAEKLSGATTIYGVTTDLATPFAENVFKFRTAPEAPNRPFIMSDQRGVIVKELQSALSKHMTKQQLEQTQRAVEQALEGVEFDFDIQIDSDAAGAGVMEFRWDGKDHKLVLPKAGRASADAFMARAPEWNVQIAEAEKRAEKIQEQLSERLERLSEEIERLRESIKDLD